MVLINNLFEHIMEKSKSLVSIIMNCYNGQRFLKEAIDSVYQQTYHDWEIIFWDNASDDDSAKVAKSYDKKLKYDLRYNNEREEDLVEKAVQVQQQIDQTNQTRPILRHLEKHWQERNHMSRLFWLYLHSKIIG